MLNLELNKSVKVFVDGPQEDNQDHEHFVLCVSECTTTKNSNGYSDLYVTVDFSHWLSSLEITHRLTGDTLERDSNLLVTLRRTQELYAESTMDYEDLSFEDCAINAQANLLGAAIKRLEELDAKLVGYYK